MIRSGEQQQVMARCPYSDIFPWQKAQISRLCSGEFDLLIIISSEFYVIESGVDGCPICIGALVALNHKRCERQCCGVAGDECVCEVRLRDERTLGLAHRGASDRMARVGKSN